MTSSYINCLFLNCKYRLEISRPKTMEAWSPHDHQPTAIFQSTLLPPPPTLPAPCSPFFFHAEEAEEGSDHTYRSRPPPSTPSLQFPCHLCTSLCLQLHNSKALNLSWGVNPSLEKMRKRRRKEVREREGGGGGKEGCMKKERWRKAKVRCHET